MHFTLYLCRVINDITTAVVAREVNVFVILARITIRFGRNPRNGGSPPKDNSDVNIMHTFRDQLVPEKGTSKFRIHDDESTVSVSAKQNF